VVEIINENEKLCVWKHKVVVRNMEGNINKVWNKVTNINSVVVDIVDNNCRENEIKEMIGGIE